ncbi:MAG: peptidylprolyl isomerase [Gammaproteobacteria bacterium]|nr:peptidylprolyl isomerase [Gammaproteobacteria bacterium]
MNPLNRISCFVLLALSIQPLQAQEAAKPEELGLSQEIFASQGEVSLTEAELDAAISRIPVEFRLQYIRSGDRMDQLVSNLLRNKVIAAAALEEQFDQSPVVQGRVALAGEKELAEAWIQRKLETVPPGDYETLAYEYYLADPERYMSIPSLDVSHILISSEKRSADEALQLATELREQALQDPSRFDPLVMEYSEDPSKTGNAGRFPNMTEGQMVKEFEAAAFALDTPGEISEPVRTSYGYHLIRLNAKRPEAVRPYEEVKPVIVENVRKRYLEEYRVRYIKSLLTEPIEVEENAVESMVKRYYGDNLELAPDVSRE